jgi:hypothetical protein
MYSAPKVVFTLLINFVKVEIKNSLLKEKDLNNNKHLK